MCFSKAVLKNGKKFGQAWLKYLDVLLTLCMIDEE